MSSGSEAEDDSPQAIESADLVPDDDPYNGYTPPSPAYSVVSANFNPDVVDYSPSYSPTYSPPSTPPYYPPVPARYDSSPEAVGDDSPPHIPFSPSYHPDEVRRAREAGGYYPSLSPAYNPAREAGGDYSPPSPFYNPVRQADGNFFPKASTNPAPSTVTDCFHEYPGYDPDLEAGTWIRATPGLHQKYLSK